MPAVSSTAAKSRWRPANWSRTAFRWLRICRKLSIARWRSTIGLPASKISAQSPILVAGLYEHVLLPDRQLELAKFGNSHRLIRNKAQIVLAAQLLLNQIERLLDAQLLRDLKKAAAGFSGKPH